MSNEVPPMKISKRSSRHSGIRRYHLNQSTKLRHTLRIANHPGHRRTLTHSDAGGCHQQHQRHNRDLPLGSLHSKTVLRVEWLSEIIPHPEN
jgi:hypothetical protein